MTDKTPNMFRSWREKSKSARIAELEAQIEPNVGCGHASYDDDCAECRGNDPERYDPVDL